MEFKSINGGGMETLTTIAEIIEKAGGPAAIAEASEGALKKDAVYKWKTIGVPDRHWPILIDKAGVTPEQIYAANLAARRVAA